MNIAITEGEANQLQVVLTDALARATTMTTYPNVSDDMRSRQRAIADACLSVINTIKHEQEQIPLTPADVARAELRRRSGIVGGHV